MLHVIPSLLEILPAQSSRPATRAPARSHRVVVEQPGSSMVPPPLLNRQRLLLQGEQPGSAAPTLAELLGSRAQALPGAWRAGGKGWERRGKAAAVARRV